MIIVNSPHSYVSYITYVTKGKIYKYEKIQPPYWDGTLLDHLFLNFMRNKISAYFSKVRKTVCLKLEVR